MQLGDVIIAAVTLQEGWPPVSVDSALVERFGIAAAVSSQPMRLPQPALAVEINRNGCEGLQTTAPVIPASRAEPSWGPCRRPEREGDINVISCCYSTQ